MDIFLEPNTARIDTKVSQRAKQLIEFFARKRNIKVSQYVKLALQNQIKADQLSDKFNSPQP